MPFETDVDDALLAKATELRRTFHLDAIERDKQGGRPVEQIRLLKESGLPSAQIAREYNGQGASWLTILRIVREFAKTDGSLAHLFGYHHLPLNLILFRGSVAQKEKWLTGSAAGNWIWSNSGNAMSKTSAGEKTPTGWRINGSRPFSSGSHIADYIQISWENADGARLTAAVPADREGIVIENDWDGIGQRQTGSGTVRFVNLQVHDDELISSPDVPLTPYSSLTSLLQQSVLLNVFVGSAQGILEEGRSYATANSRPWIYSGVERHVDDPWIKRQYGDLYIRTLAATELADKAARSLGAAYAQGPSLSAADRGAAAIDIATANVYAGEVGLAVSSEVFEVMGARSATNANGFDRFWRNVRTHTLHNPAEYKKRSVGTWLLTGEFPVPAMYR
ncbi:MULTISPECIES: acyl-CoA dehydrogenase family protein [unclassified Rhizobium]|uniref:acyl-CoA dehydrogenase family protein n=1 Tax=unclassified Rhizobium TaxID=2613769 RepID=UPI00160D2737|nr:MULTISPECIES: acyl-CoA dehydrogenase family protein [unclassified Rhizobium]MBB3398507.1 alkylation response protein AidB-like acyl-CoA dehydrogenase [Rhizobium sp. BK060]MBB4171320.1 alkylation response protein AidB-like acyl-CoA dehydrogenase [Rhizobium sp. BK538]